MDIRKIIEKCGRMVENPAALSISLIIDYISDIYIILYKSIVLLYMMIEIWNTVKGYCFYYSHDMRTSDFSSILLVSK